MSDIIIYFGIGVFFFGIFILVIPGINSRRKISRLQKRNFQKQISKILCNRCSVKEEIINLDILLHKILLKIGYRGTLGEILKQSPEYINDINKVWEVHKIRNNLVHNLDNDYSEKFLRLKLAEFTKEIKMLLGNI